MMGALFSLAVFSYATRALSEEPFRSVVIEQITTYTVDAAWYVIFLEAIECGFSVTLAIYLGTQNHDGMSKALALHLAFFMSTTTRFLYTVECMYICSIGMMLGALLLIGSSFWEGFATRYPWQ